MSSRKWKRTLRPPWRQEALVGSERLVLKEAWKPLYIRSCQNSLKRGIIPCKQRKFLVSNWFLSHWCCCCCCCCSCLLCCQTLLLLRLLLLSCCYVLLPLLRLLLFLVLLLPALLLLLPLPLMAWFNDPRNSFEDKRQTKEMLFRCVKLRAS